MPGANADVAEYGPAVAESGRPRSPDVVETFVVIVGEERWNPAVPARQVGPLAQEVLVVLPDPYESGRGLEVGGQRLRLRADLLQPALHRIFAPGFIEPVPVKDGEVDPVLELPQHGGESRQRGSDRMPGVLVVSAGELEAEIKEAFGVQLGVFESLRARQRTKRTAPGGAANAIGEYQLVIVFRVRLQPLEMDPAGIVPVEAGFDRVACRVKLARRGSVLYRERTRARRTAPDTDTVGAQAAEDRAVGYIVGDLVFRRTDDRRQEDERGRAMEF